MSCSIGKRAAFNAILRRARSFTFPAAVSSHASFEDYLVFMSCKVLERDFDAATCKLIPNTSIHSVWVSHMLVPVNYIDFCELLAGRNRIIGHNGFCDNTSYHFTGFEKERAMAELYKNLLGSSCPWFEHSYKPVVFVRSTVGHMYPVVFDSGMTIAQFKDKLSEMSGISPCEMSLMFCGKSFNDGLELKYYNIQRESTLWLNLRLRGC